MIKFYASIKYKTQLYNTFIDVTKSKKTLFLISIKNQYWCI